MDFKELEAFQQVVEKGSYSEAAKSLFVSQPTITHRIQSLQEKLDVTLLKSNGRKIELTFSGSILLEYVNTILAQKNEALQMVNKSKGIKFNNLHISTTSIGIYIIPQITSSFQKIYPGVQLSLSFSNATSAIKQLLEGKTDLVISPAPLHNEKLSSEVVGFDTISLIASTDHQLAKRDGLIEFDDLKEYKFVIREEGSNTREHFKTWCEIYNFQPRDFMEMDQTEAIKIAVLNNIGISVMSQLIIENDPRSEKFKILNVRGLPVQRPIQVFMLTSNKDNPLKKQFVQFLKEQMSALKTNYF